MKILYLSPFSPYPPDNGASIRIAGTLKCLAQNHYVDFVSLTSQTTISNLEEIYASEDWGRMIHFHALEKKSRGEPNAGLKKLNAFWAYPSESFLRFWSHRNLLWLRHYLCNEQFDIFYMETELLGMYLSELHKLLSSQTTAVIVSFMDVLSVVTARYASRMSFGPYRLRYMLDVLKLKHFESSVLSWSQTAVTTTKIDRDHLLSINNKCPVQIIPNGIEIPGDLAISRLGQGIQPTLLLVGTFGYEPNLDGFLFVVNQILPRIKKDIPNIRFVAAGKKMTQEMKEIASAHKEVQLIENFHDLDTIYGLADIAVVPIRTGGGMRTKILEAFARGLPVVSTSIGCEGIEATHAKHLLVADEPESFASGVVKLLHSRELYQELVNEARAFVERYSWKNLAPSFEAVLVTAVQRKIN